jgi:hypothetical protein
MPSKFKNIADQIEVVGSRGTNNDIYFYNKKDASDNLILGFKADNGRVIMFSVVNGVEQSALESVLYSEVTLPTSTDLEDLVEQLNLFLIVDGTIEINDTDAIHDNVASEISAITAKGTPTTSDYLIIEDAADSNNKKSITLGSLPVEASKTVFSSYKIGATVGPSTTATTSDIAPVLAEMTHTFTPANATNKIEVFFSGTFQQSADNNSRCGIFIDGTLKGETEVRTYAAIPSQWHGSLATFWQGTLSAVPHTITIGFWSNAGTITSVDIMRKMLIKEIAE